MDYAEASVMEIVARNFGSDSPKFTPELAQELLGLQFDSAAISRMNELANKSRAGSLSDAESAELEGYLSVGSLLDLIQSRSRQVITSTSDRSASDAGPLIDENGDA